jgi:hypothetical protein
VSERGTFVTSFLYDETLVPVLRAALSKVARPGSLAEIGPPSEHTLFPTRAFAGVMHGGYGGEESILDMPSCIEDDILPNLPSDHGQFSIAVMPEWEEYTRLFVIAKGTVTDFWLNNEAGREMSEPLAPPPPRLNISDIARGLTSKPE